MRESSTGYVLLGVLAFANGPKTGFEIRGFLEEAVHFYWRESFGQIYPELKRLHGEGLIKPASARGLKRDAQPWRITPAGLAVLREWLDRPAQARVVRDETLLKLFFSRHASAGSAAKLIDAARAAAEARLVVLEAGERAVLADAGDPDLLNSLTVIARGQMEARMRLAWCARADALREAWESGGAEALIRQWRRT